MTDFTAYLNTTDREVTRTGDQVSVRLRRTYETVVDDLWEALTDRRDRSGGRGLARPVRP